MGLVVRGRGTRWMGPFWGWDPRMGNRTIPPLFSKRMASGKSPNWPAARVAHIVSLLLLASCCSPSVGPTFQVRRHSCTATRKQDTSGLFYLGRAKLFETGERRRSADWISALSRVSAAVSPPPDPVATGSRALPQSAQQEPVCPLGAVAHANWTNCGLEFCSRHAC